MPFYTKKSTSGYCIIDCRGCRGYGCNVPQSPAKVMYRYTPVWGAHRLSKVDEDAKCNTGRNWGKTHKADPYRCGQKVVPVHYTGIKCTGATLCPCRLDQLYVHICLNSIVFHFCVLIFVKLLWRGHSIPLFPALWFDPSSMTSHDQNVYFNLISSIRN